MSTQDPADLIAATLAECEELRRKVQECALMYLSRDGECIELLAERDRLRAEVAELLSCLEIIKQRTTHTTYRIGHDVHRMAEGLLAKHQKGASNGK